MRAFVAWMFFVTIVGLWGGPPAVAKCETLYAEVQARLKQSEADGRDPLLRERARQCAEEGIKRHGQNRHWESMTTFRRCLKMFDE